MDTKTKIINAMTQLFSIKGYMASMSDISKIVGIKVSSIYSHFKGKDEILYLAIDNEISLYYEYCKDIYEKLKDNTTEEILKGIYFGILCYYSDSQKLMFTRNIDLIPENEYSTMYKELQKNYMIKNINIIEEIFTKGYKNGEIKYNIDKGFPYLYLTMIRGILSGMST